MGSAEELDVIFILIGWEDWPFFPGDSLSA